MDTINNKANDNKFNNNVDNNKIEHSERIVNNKKNRKVKKYSDVGLTFRYLEAYNDATSDCYVFLKSLEKLLNVEAEIKMSKKIHDEIKSGNLTYSDFLNHKLDVIDKTIKALDINFVNKDADEDADDDGNGNSEENSEEKREKKLQRFRELINEISGAYDKNDKNDKKDENEEDNSNNGNDNNDSNDSSMSNDKKDVKDAIKEEDKKEDIKEFLEKKNAEKLERDLKRLKIDSLLNIENYRGESDKVLEFIKTFYDSLRRNLSILRKYFE